MPNPVAQGDFRTICVMPVIIIVLHQILAKRLEKVQHKYQSGFQSDGPLLSIFSFLKPFWTTELRSPTSMSHFWTSARRLIYLITVCLPPGLVQYIWPVYSTFLRIVGDWIRQGGVFFQKDPLSSMLFNIPLDYVLKSLSPDVSYRHGAEVIPALAFADDLILFATTRRGMELSLSLLVEGADQIGLILGPQKCATMPLYHWYL